jgi:hypothetical protein
MLHQHPKRMNLLVLCPYKFLIHNAGSGLPANWQTSAPAHASVAAAHAMKRIAGHADTQMPGTCYLITWQHHRPHALLPAELDSLLGCKHLITKCCTA